MQAGTDCRVFLGLSFFTLHCVVCAGPNRIGYLSGDCQGFHGQNQTLIISTYCSGDSWSQTISLVIREQRSTEATHSVSVPILVKRGMEAVEQSTLTECVSHVKRSVSFLGSSDEIVTYMWNSILLALSCPEEAIDHPHKLSNQ